MVVRSAVAFLAGFASVITPCVLPLVPGYLSQVSSIGTDRLARGGVARRVVLASVPFIAGFTAVFVLLGAGAAAIGGVLSDRRQTDVAGVVLVALGLAFMGALPWADRVFAPDLLTAARRRRSSALLGGAFAICVGPCVGTVLGSILVLAGDADTIFRGAFLLAVYSLGLGSAFVLAGVAFTGAMRAFRWLRDHYGVIRVVSGSSLVALGLLLFFGRDWWLYSALDRLLDAIGLGEI